MFQPSHCPESNLYAFGGAKPQEQVWQYLKKGLRWDLTNNLDELRLLISQQLEKMNSEVIASIIGRAYILEAISVAGS